MPGLGGGEQRDKKGTLPDAPTLQGGRPPRQVPRLSPSFVVICLFSNPEHHYRAEG